MAWCPFAKQMPLGWSAPPIRPELYILHSAVTPPGYNLWQQWHNNGENGVACHFYVRGDGSIEQYLDSAVKANAQYSGNSSGISVETEGMDPDHTPWNPDELLALERLGNWIHLTHGIPLQLVSTPAGPGIGYHAQFQTWNHDAHSCPGGARIAQIPALIAAMSHANPTPPEEPDVLTIEIIAANTAPGTAYAYNGEEKWPLVGSPEAIPPQQATLWSELGVRVVNKASDGKEATYASWAIRQIDPVVFASIPDK